MQLNCVNFLLELLHRAINTHPARIEAQSCNEPVKAGNGLT